MSRKINQTNECEKANDLIMKYMDGELTEDEAKELRDHVAGCTGCKADFDVYDMINDGLTCEGLTPAPEGFTQSVMELVAALPSSKKLAASNFDRIMSAVFGVFSLLFGTGFLLVLNRESVIEYLSGIPLLQRYLNAVSPTSEGLSEVLTAAVDNAYGAVMTGLGFFSEYRYVILSILLVLVVSQVVLFRRKSTAGEKAKIR